MSGISRILYVPVHYAVEWRRNIVRRNGTEDARRAQEARLLSQQAGPPIGGYPCAILQEQRARVSRLT
jgi:hypothetical protein